MEDDFVKPDWVQMSEYMQQLRQLARRAAVHQRLPLTGSELEPVSYTHLTLPTNGDG